MTRFRSPAATASPFDVEAVRAQFPILATQAHGRPLVYLDNAASAQKPRAVVEAVSDYYLGKHANIHRGAYLLSQTATRLYEEARERVARFINAAEPAECLFTRGTTESINLVASSWGMQHLGPGDEIILSLLEHHSNIVPWQLVAERTGARIRVIPIDDAGDLQLDAYYQMLSPRTRLVAIGQVSNALGTINPVAEIIAAAHAIGALVLIDGAQWVAHGRTDVQALDADFYAFSGHKLYGPTGIGVLYGKRRLLDAMPPYQGGGDMIAHVSFTETTFAELPNKFEAGTPHIAGAVGLAAAIDWLDALGLEAVAAHEDALLREATTRLAEIPGLELKGTARHKAGVLSWVAVDPPISTLDMGTRLDLEGICVRTGHHCCEPLMDRLGVTSTARASFGVYNNRDDVERLAGALAEVFARARRRPGAERAAAIAETIAYPGAVAASPAAVAEEIRELFEVLPDWPMRYQQLIELGEGLPAMPEGLKTRANFVSGCQSQVYLAARVRPGTDDVIEFLADADADIVRGLIALLQRLFSGQRAADILAFDASAFFAELGLDQHLSLTRRNGLAAMAHRLRELAGLYGPDPDAP
ncbi:SufS family cysteine desulfurase [Thiococcus pfennigii]|uniref:SufS family cysteine desulfurase n=1 Tax=Thiococcus pfennigii TaxID=1057 RepID=UPI0019057F1A|nr:SufS family cysteine desulfurase [Thiococcus pfennigii]MBK1731930.1 cysteine desulfurase [Thiococcus pfennigii]